MNKYDFTKKESERNREEKSQDVSDFFRKEVGETREFVKKINDKNSNNVRIVLENVYLN